MGTVALAFALAAAPWPAKSWALTGNPLFPFATKLFGGPGWWDARSERSFIAEARTYGHHGGSEQRRYGPAGGVLSDWLLGPVWLLLRYDREYGSPAGPGPAYLVLLLSVLLTRRRRLGRSRASPLAPLVEPLLFAAGMYVFWMLTAQRLRYLLPGLAIAATVAGMSAAGLRSLARQPRVGPVAVGLLLWACVIWSGSDQLRLHEPLAYLAGFQSGEEYLTAPNPLRQDGRARVPYLRVAQYANDCLPEDASILFVGETRSYYFEVPCEAETGFTGSTAVMAANLCKRAEDIPRLLQRLGYTHVLYDFQSPQERWARQLNYFAFQSDAAARRLGEALADHMELLYAAEGVGLFALQKQPERR